MKRKSLSVIKKTLNFYQTKLKDPQVRKLYNLFSNNLASMDLTNKKIMVGVSGGADSLAVLFFSQCYALKNRVKLYPVIIDHNSNQTVFESGAILIYLAEKSGKFYDKKNRLEINQWLMVQMGYVGPMLGQHHQFHHYNPGKSEFGEKRYFKIAKRIYDELDERLSKSKFLSGDEYTIADIGTFPWIARHEWHDIGLKKFKNLTRWYLEISNRSAVKKGFSFMNIDETPPLP